MAGGLGTRMRSELAKHLHPLLGRRMVDWVVEAARPLAPEPLVVVASPDTAEALRGDAIVVAVQERPLGTGDAVRSAQPALGTASQVLVLSGDTPLLTTRLLEALVSDHHGSGSACTVLSFRPSDMRSYGRVVRDAGGDVRAIVEAADATESELEVGEANSSIYVFRSEMLWPALARLRPANAQGELYLTDVVRDLVASGERVTAHVAEDAAETEGVNTRVELADAAAALRDRVLVGHMLAGVTVVDPGTTWIDATVVLEPDTTIQPFTQLRGTTVVRSGAVVGPHAVVDSAEIGPDARVGPFCYVRPGTVLGQSAKAGTFVELKQARLGDRTKVPHLSYIGDADIGDDTNVGAGSITANFPHGAGIPKGTTTIGRNARLAVDTMLVAPVTLGDDVWTAPGTVVTDDVPDNALVGFAPRQTIKEGRGGKRDD